MDQRKINIVLVIVYIVLALITAFSLFTFQDDLVYGVQALPTSKIAASAPVFTKLYITVLITLFGGLFILLYLFNNKGQEIIYIEKKDENDEDNTNASAKSNEEKTFDVESIKHAVSAKSKSQEKLISEGLAELCKRLEAGVGAFYMLKKDGARKVLQMNATYAMSLGESQRPVYELGEGLVGQAGSEGQPLILDSVPEGYIQIVSGLGNSSPTHLLIVPVRYGKEVFGVVEIASFTKFSEAEMNAVEKSFEVISDKLFEGKEATTKTAKSDGEKQPKTTKPKTAKKKDKD